MKNQQDNLGSQDGKIDLKMWMEEHPQEYGEFAAAMGEADSLEVFLLGCSSISFVAGVSEAIGEYD